MGLAAPTKEKAASDGREFRDAVTALRDLVGEDLDRVGGAIIDSMGSSTPLIPEVAGHLIQSGGKRLRPMLTLAAARLCGYEGEAHVKLAAAVELIHGATLLHDDVVDASALRRGARTANIIWGNKESVLVGDFIFARAFELMVGARNLEVLQILSSASGVIAEGEVLQLATQKNLEATFEMYLAVVESKTAALFSAATHSGAVISEASDPVAEALKNYGRNLGIAYQLIDDALDYAGYEASLGKSVGDDFREGKMTLPVVYAIARATPDEAAFWKRTIADGRQGPEDFARARDIVSRNGALADTHLCARRYADRALEDLTHAPDNAFSRALAALAETSLTRGF
ncbi:MAG: polyprenyl synthetase family protein [Parvularculaceae bacterium]